MIQETQTVATLELVEGDFDFPTSLAIAPGGEFYIGESGLPFAGASPGARIWRIVDGRRELLASGLSFPLTGLTWADGGLYASTPGSIHRLDGEGNLSTVIDGLPTGGNYHTNMVAVGTDGWLYFGQGSMTNSGVVGPDGLDLAWLRTLSHPHDIPGYAIELTGFEASSEITPEGGPTQVARTGAFAPYGTTTPAGSPIPAGLPCTAAVMRCRPDGSDLELVAWGLRNPFGLGFLADGRLLAVDQGADDRGSRPLGNVPDLLFEVHRGAWYGWPDFIGDDPVTSYKYRPERGGPVEFLISNHAELPPPQPPLFRFPAHVAATKFDVAPNSSTLAGRIVVALFGDERPMTAPPGPRMGRSIVTIDLATGSFEPLASGPLARPIDVRFHPDGTLFVLDFGSFEMQDRGGMAAARSGSLWRMPIR